MNPILKDLQAKLTREAQQRAERSVEEVAKAILEIKRTRDLSLEEIETVRNVTIDAAKKHVDTRPILDGIRDRAR